MKHIEKGSEPEIFSDWIRGQNEEDEDPSWVPSWAAFDCEREVKRAVRLSLLVEQGWICCYCGKRIESADAHIEHMKPRSREEYENLALDYSNFLMSCTAPRSRHCGMKKGDWFEEDLFVPPLDPNCESRFKFRSNGHIEPASEEDAAALETIRILGLDDPHLVAQRRGAIEGTGLTDRDTPSGDLLDMINNNLQRDECGRFEPYCFAIVDILRRYTQ